MQQLMRCLAALCIMSALAGNAWSADAVEELRQAIPVRREDSSKAANVLTYRQALLQKRIDALKTSGELRRALTLREWKDDPALDLKLQEQNTAMRGQIGKRLEARLRAVADMPGPENATFRLAVASMIAELGPEVPDLNDKDRTGFARTLTPIVVKLAGDSDLGVRQEALRALSTINPAAKDAAAVFRKTLANPNEAVGPRRLAADGLGQLMRVLLTLEKRTGGTVIVTSAQKLETIKEVVNSASPALADRDWEVRAFGLSAIQISAQALSEMVDRQRLQPKSFPPPGRLLTPDEIKYIQFQQDEVQKEITEFGSELAALNNQGAQLSRVLRDPEPRVQIKALEAIESIGYTRLRLRHLAAKIPTVKGNEAVAGTPEALKKALASSDPLGQFLQSNGLAQVGLVFSAASPGPGVAMYDENSTRIRRSAIDFLATLEEDATPAVGEIIRALGDSDRFVRWSAVMVVENIPAEKRVATIPALTRLLTDNDLNVRLEGTKALGLLGSRAGAARSALIEAINHGDVEARVAAMRALEAVGLERNPSNPETQQGVAVMISALSHNDPRMRRMAAETLGRLGALARSAVPALRSRLGDEDDEVRARAGEALLSILEGAK